MKFPEGPINKICEPPAPVSDFKSKHFGWGFEIFDLDGDYALFMVVRTMEFKRLFL